MQSMTRCFCAAALTLSALAAASGSENDIRNAVVRVIGIRRSPNVDNPWAKLPPNEVTGSGVLIDGNRILTAAHVVLFTSQVMIQPHNSSDRHLASVVAIAPGVDLACLKLDDAATFADRQPLALDTELPELQDEISVYGFPVGGSGLSITKGVVSRINFGQFSEIEMPIPTTLSPNEEPSLRIQVDAALNSGNSGGPAIVNGRVAGIASSVLRGAANIGYLIPSEEVEGFLKSIDAGGYKPKPRILDTWQPLVNHALRSKLGLDSKVTGVVIRTPFRSTAESPLKSWDVVQQIGEHPIDNSGNVRVRDNLRLRFDYFVAKEARDNSVALTILRSGTTMQVALPVISEPELVMPSLKGKYPTHFIYGPVVFSQVSAEYVDVAGPIWWSLWGRMNSPLISRRNSLAEFPGEELVVIAAQLPHKSISGYKNRYTQVVAQVNGVRVRNLRHLVEILRDMREPWVTLEFFEKDAETIVLNHKEVLDATTRILADNGIPQQASAELLKIWQAERP